MARDVILPVRYMSARPAVRADESADSVRPSPLPGCLYIPTQPGLLIRAALGTSLAHQILMT